MKTIIISVFNTFLDEEIVRYIFPYDPYKAMFGWYSSFWRDMKPVLASVKNIDKKKIKANIFLTKNKTDRMKVVLPRGLALDAPFDMSKKDCEIIQMNLESIRMAL